MKLIILGDSITRGTFTDIGQESPGSIAKPNYSERLKELLGADELLCMGMNGVSVSRTATIFPENALSILCEQCKEADIFVIAGGTNDWGNPVELGTEKDREDISFYGGLSVLFERVKALNPKAKIFAVLPIRRKGEWEKPNKIGRFLSEYRVAILRRAIEYGITVIDGQLVPINPDDEQDREKYMLDGLHPNNEGHRLYAEVLYKEIKKYV